MIQTAISVIEIKIEVFEGASGKQYCISSDDVPGLFLAGPDIGILSRDIIPAIQTLFKRNRGIDVEVRPATPLEAFPQPEPPPPERADTYLLFPQVACA